MATVSVDDAVSFTESTVRLWSVADNVQQGTFFRMTPQLFNDWKTTHQISRILAEEIPQDAQGLLKFTTVWQTKRQSVCKRQLKTPQEDGTILKMSGRIGTDISIGIIPQL